MLASSPVAELLELFFVAAGTMMTVLLSFVMVVVPTMAMVAALVWFALFAVTLGFDAPLEVRLVRRWAGALCLCGLALFAIPWASGQWALMLTLLGLAGVPLARAVAFTRELRQAQNGASNPVEPRHN